MRNVYLYGSGLTKFGELWDKSLVDLGVEAAQKALESSSVKSTEIDALIVANMSAEALASQAHLGALFSQALELNGPAYRVEAACASGGEAVHLAWQLIRSGVYNNVLVLGVEKMSDVPVSFATQALMGAAKEQTEGYAGATFPSLYAMIAREHFRLYGTTREDLAKISVKNHANAVNNPHAQFRSEITVEQVLKSADVASPLGLLDCSPISDGAAAVVLSAESAGGVEIVASAMAHDTIDLAARTDLTSLQSTKKAAKLAYTQAGISAKNIDIAEVHDCFTIAELIAYEDLGFVKKGDGAKFVANPTVPVNVSGGLKATGHPVGATGVKQLIELALQLQNKAGTRQLSKKLKWGLAHNVGGSGGTAVVTIMRAA